MRKKIKIVLLSVSGVIILLFGILMGHIISVVKERKQAPNATLSIARADFKKALHPNIRFAIDKKLQEQAGIKSSFWNERDNTLVYAFDNRKNTADGIFMAAIKTQTEHVERVIISAAEAGQGCPAGYDKNPFYAGLMSFANYVTN